MVVKTWNFSERSLLKLLHSKYTVLVHKGIHFDTFRILPCFLTENMLLRVRTPFQRCITYSGRSRGCKVMSHQTVMMITSAWNRTRATWDQNGRFFTQLRRLTTLRPLDLKEYVIHLGLLPLVNISFVQERGSILKVWSVVSKYPHFNTVV